MKKSILQNVLVIIGVILYQTLFWQEKLGLNVLVFTVLIQASLWYLHPENRSHGTVIITGLGTLITAILVVIHNSTLVKLIHFLSLCSFVGFVQEREFRFIFYAFFLFLKTAFRIPLETLDRLNQALTGGMNWRRLQYRASLVLIPFIVLVVFYLIYYRANPQFAALSDDFWFHFFDLFHWDISFSRVMFSLLGLVLVGAVFWQHRSHNLVAKQLAKSLQLVRQRVKRKGRVRGFGTMGLKKEYQSGLLLVASLNVLLLLVNFLDIQYVWFGEQPTNPAEWKIYVHEGTYLLIVAILLAMAILLVLFRRNLNFYIKNKALQTMAYVWIAQNAILALSVGIRNWRYVEHCGLAYKRIGVFIFLLLVFYGLFTMHLKVRDKRSFYFLLFRNSWAMYAVFVAATFVNWDVVITRYNLTAETESGIDVAFLAFEVSDKNLYLLMEHQDLLDSNVGVNREHVGEVLQNKQQRFERQQEGLSFWSWNYPDWRNQQYLTGQKGE